MGFIDEIRRLARPYEDEEDEEEYDDFEPPVSRPERREKARLWPCQHRALRADFHGVGGAAWELLRPCV